MLRSCLPTTADLVLLYDRHWRRLFKNIGWANQNIGEKKVVKSDKFIGVSQLLGARARAAPLSLRLWWQTRCRRSAGHWVKGTGPSAPKSRCRPLPYSYCI